MNVEPKLSHNRRGGPDSQRSCWILLALPSVPRCKNPSQDSKYIRNLNWTCSIHPHDLAKRYPRKLGFFHSGFTDYVIPEAIAVFLCCYCGNPLFEASEKWAFYHHG